MLTKAPMFSLSAAQRLAKRIWYRSLAGIKNGILKGASLDTSTSSPATRLPQEVVNMIIAYLIHDTHTLLTCSLVSRSWYIAAVPHLHRTLVARMNPFTGDKETKWPKSLRMASKFGSLPFVTRLFIYGDPYGHEFSPKRFHYWTRREFSALTNVRELSIGGLDIPSFIPTIQQYFGQFSPTVRSLSLRGPKGTYRQIVFFIGLFPHLEDLTIHTGWSYDWNALDDPTLIPPFVPPFGGRLTATSGGGYYFAKTLIDLFGKVQFRHMDLLHMDSGTQLLVYACADTLETLELDATDICGWSRDLDLSRNNSLCKLKTTARSLISSLRDRAPGTVQNTFRAIISTIDSPTFSDFVVAYQLGDFYNVTYPEGRTAEFGDEDAWYRRQFEVFREMYKARDFQLLLWAYCVSDSSVRELERAVAVEKAKGGLPPRLSMAYSLAAR